MANIPEGVETATGEGDDLKRAILAAAESLGLPAERVGHTLDMSHFRNAGGGVVAKRTVKVIAWALPEGETAKSPATASAKPARKPRKPRSDDEAPKKERSERSERRPSKPRSEERERRTADTGDLAETEASKAALAWFVKLVDLMGLEGTLQAKGNDERIVLDVDVNRAGQIIGRRGSTLSAIRHLLKLALSEHGDFIIDVEIPDSRDGDDKKSRSDDGGSRGKRGGGRGRGRRSDDGPKGEYPEDKLQAVGKRAAEKAKSSGKPVTINLLLNSYDRRIIHVAVQEVDGISSQSIVKDGKKYVQVVPED